MKRVPFKSASFVTTAMKASQYPRILDKSGNPLPEVAVAGRSNVGKSSLLNDLFNNRKLVKTSSTPGKTQALNFFNVDEVASFADLPGYGYAKVPDSVRKHWGPMVQTYLKERSSLHLLLFLLDIRRIPNDDDLQFIEWVLSCNKAMILVLTKVDKVTANVRRANTQKILKKIDLENLHYTHYSATKRVGRKELIHMVNDALIDEVLHGTA